MKLTRSLSRKDVIERSGQSYFLKVPNRQWLHIRSVYFPPISSSLHFHSCDEIGKLRPAHKLTNIQNGSLSVTNGPAPPYDQTLDFRPPAQAYINPASNNHFNSPPLTGASIGPYTGSGYFPSPPPPHYPPGAYYNSPPPPPSLRQYQQQAGMLYNQPPPPLQHPGMFYGPPPPPSQPVLLGFVKKLSTDRAVYGPPGASFDWLGNVYFDDGHGRKEYVGVYRDNMGRIREPPRQHGDDEIECCGVRP